MEVDLVSVRLVVERDGQLSPAVLEAVERGVKCLGTPNAGIERLHNGLGRRDEGVDGDGAVRSGEIRQIRRRTKIFGDTVEVIPDGVAKIIVALFIGLAIVSGVLAQPWIK